jgi:hypothetical protein
MKNIFNALSRLSQFTPDQHPLTETQEPSYRRIIGGFLESLENDTDMLPEVDRDTRDFRRRAMSANYSR